MCLHVSSCTYVEDLLSEHYMDINWCFRDTGSIRVFQAAYRHVKSWAGKINHLSPGTKRSHRGWE